MQQSEKLDKLAPALAKAQSEMAGAVKGKANDFFKSKYADLTSVWQACKEALHDNGFSVIQSPIDREGRIGVATMLLHTTGQFISGEYTLGVAKPNNPQADGSSITYARRYALAAFVGVCPVDDDAEGAMNRNKPVPETKVTADKLVVYVNQLDKFKSKKEVMAWAESIKNKMEGLKKTDKVLYGKIKEQTKMYLDMWSEK